MDKEIKVVVEKIEKRDFSPVYFLQGEESYFLKKITTLLKGKILKDNEKSFNEYIVYGSDISLDEILLMARRFPMMSEYQTIFVHEAQKIKGWGNQKQQETLLAYLSNPLKTTILTFIYRDKLIDKRTKIGKSILSKTTFIDSKKLYDDQVLRWIHNYCLENNFHIDNHSVALLFEFIGNNLNRLELELGKLFLNIKDKNITSDKVHQYVNINREYNIFELQKKIGMMDYFKAQQMLRFFSGNPSKYPIILIVNSMYTYFTRLLKLHLLKTNIPKEQAKHLGVHPFFLKEYESAIQHYPLHKVLQNMQLLYEADLRAKGIKGKYSQNQNFLVELLFQIMN